MRTLKYIAAIALLLTVSLASFAQHRIAGFVKDSLSREVLVGAHIIDSTRMRVVTTDNTGYFSINVQENSCISASFVGYKPQAISSKSEADSLIVVLLSPHNSIDEVVVTHAKRHTHSVASLSNLELQQLPSLGAKPDVMKAIQLLPGIQSQNEGTSTILVRGGNPGENLYLFDNIALIYVNHLGGFTSVFNPDIINNIKVYKGGFPSRYGGKLSSIMDIAQREGNVNKLKGSYSIGITDASILLEGPTSIKNTTFIVAGRKTLVDPLFALATMLSGGGDYIMSYGFHDINGKFTWRPDAKNALSINLYQGDDYLNWWYSNRNNSGRERARLSNVWGNWLLSARWNRVHNPSLYSTQSLSYVRYRLKNNQNYFNTDPDSKFEYKRNFKSIVQDISYKWDLKAELHQNLGVDFGLHTAYLRYNPNNIYISNNPAATSQPTINALEPSAYAEAKFELPKILTLRLGARAAGYVTEQYNTFKIEPRANLNINIGANHTLNASYMETNQFSHLLFTQGEIMSNEVWVPAGADISPASTQQISGGWRGFFNKGMWDVELSAYHKTLHNIATYREGYTSLMGDGNWRSKVEAGGEGEAYGVEFFMRKTRGSWTGFLGYSWSRATRQFSNINNGNEYAFDYDRPHSLSLTLNRKLNAKLTLSATWVIQSGLPFTPVYGRQFVPSLTDGSDDDTYYYEAFIYGEKNSAQMRPYHRLDLALHYTTKTKYGNKAQWTFAVYNAYNRQNPYTYVFTHDAKQYDWLILDPDIRGAEPFSLYQISFFPILPTVSYSVFFDDIKGFRKQRAKTRKTKDKEGRKRRSWLYFDD
ncbi:MAG: TonB-dependent receptor [Bacteroidales bacterium]|nr:TonB-dependent receptor [Bacteroidales bacterium]MDD4673400.1 TonB-dependent receptor [Bacteroidales bacterium]